MTTARRCAALAVLTIVAVLPASADELTRLEFPGDFPGPPFYARLSVFPLEADGRVAIPFIRDPAFVRPTFNLLALFDVPWAFFAPLESEGFVLQDDSGAIHKAVTRGLPGMPVWFVSAAEFAAEAADGVVLIGDVLAMSTLRQGAADTYREELHPGAAGKPDMINIVSRGRVGDETFLIHFVETGGSGPRGSITFK
jgi:hypothetical protein